MSIFYRGTKSRCPGRHASPVRLEVTVGGGWAWRAQGCVQMGLGTQAPPEEDRVGGRWKNLGVYGTLSRVQVVFRLELRR